MKILFITRSTLFTNRGGDTIQVVNTARFLKELGVETTIHLTTDTIDYTPFDLIHFFNLIRPADILVHIRKARKPFVVSTIFVEYGEFDQTQRKGLSGLVFRVLPSGLIEYLKVVARRMASGEKIMSPEYLWMGHRRAIRKIIRQSAMLLPNSKSEYDRIRKAYGIDHPYRVIPNAVDLSLFSGKESGVKDPKIVLCVGRIEGLKNQLNLIRALKGTSFQLFIIGEPATNQPAYFEQCKIEAGANVQFRQGLKQEDLVDYYSRAKVHVLPSWFETTGLSSLEAAAMGCAIVITEKGDAREYFGDAAFYCDPASPQSILEAVKAAAQAPNDGSLKQKVRSQYNWQVTASETQKAYQSVLSKLNPA